MSVDSNKLVNVRMVGIWGIFAALILYLLFGLVWRQVFQSFEYQKIEEKQNQRRIVKPAPRGNIYDRNGVLLVGNRPLFSSVVYLEELRSAMYKEYLRLRNEQLDLQKESPEIKISYGALRWQGRLNVVQGYLDKVNKILGSDFTLSEKGFKRHYLQERLLPFPLVSDLTAAQYALLTEQLPLDSPIQIHSDSVRYYPFQNSASHILGYVGSTDDISDVNLPGEELRTMKLRGKLGRTGIERSFDDHLQGASGADIYRVDPSGFQNELISAVPPVQGKSLHLSIDIGLQQLAEESFGDKRGGLVMMDIHTGEVLAMVSKPDYDLNLFSPSISQKDYQGLLENEAMINRSLQGLYPPGSTFKPIVASAGLRYDLFDPDVPVLCEGYYRVGNRLFPDHNRSGFGYITLDKALAVSSNVYFYQLGLRLGIDRIAEEAKLFKLDQPTSIELPFETKRMIVPTKEWKKERLQDSWYPGDTANASIGQGFFRVTPLQMACYTASFARGEVETTPTILKAPYRKVSSAKIGIGEADQTKIIEGMEQVVTLGSGRRAQVKGLRIAGKTGSAQDTIKGKRLTLAWFIAYAPVENPQVAIAVLVEPTSKADNYHGGTTAAPIAQPVLEAYFKDKPELSLTSVIE